MRVVTDFIRGLPVKALLVLIAVVAIVVGVIAGFVHDALGGPLETAHALAEQGSYEDAERIYLDLAAKDPSNVPVLLELVENHVHLVVSAAKDSTTSSPARDTNVVAVLAKASPDAALLVKHWEHVLEEDADDDERAGVVAAADRTPPVPWANDVLGQEARRAGDLGAAAKRFAREAQENPDRRGDARLACQLWASLGEWSNVDRALADVRFNRLLGPSNRLDLAIRRGQWVQTLRWVIPADYERTTIGIALLTALSATVWFAIVSRIGSPLPIAQRVPLHASAFVLGVASAYAAIVIFAAEVHVFPSLGSGSLDSELLDCLFGVGPREEIAKAVLLLPVLVWIKRHGTRRDALACGGLVGLGFAAAENLGYFERGLSTALTRFVTANLLHIAATGLVAGAIDDALRRRASRGNGIGWTLAFVAVMHGLYDVVLTFVPSEGFSKLAMLSLLFFWLIVRSFLSAVREVIGRDVRLADALVVGTALITAATFVYASALVGTKTAAIAVFEGLIATILVFGLVMDHLEDEAR